MMLLVLVLLLLDISVLYQLYYTITCSSLGGPAAARCRGRAAARAQVYRRTVGLHNFNLRIFNLRVSNPNKLTNCGCFC